MRLEPSLLDLGRRDSDLVCPRTDAESKFNEFIVSSAPCALGAIENAVGNRQTLGAGYARRRAATRQLLRG